MPRYDFNHIEKFPSGRNTLIERQFSLYYFKKRGVAHDGIKKNSGTLIQPILKIFPRVSDSRNLLGPNGCVNDTFKNMPTCPYMVCFNDVKKFMEQSGGIGNESSDIVNYDMLLIIRLRTFLMGRIDNMHTFYLVQKKKEESFIM